jgi:hypothetical protein
MRVTLDEEDAKLIADMLREKAYTEYGEDSLARRKVRLNEWGFDQEHQAALLHAVNTYYNKLLQLSAKFKVD